MAETGSEAHALCPRLAQEKSMAMIHALGRLHIGGGASVVWADPPNGLSGLDHGTGHSAPSILPFGSPWWTQRCWGQINGLQNRGEHGARFLTKKSAGVPR